MCCLFGCSMQLTEKNGGIFTQLDEQGGLYGREKSVWFQGRALWVFAKAYQVIEKNPAYLEAAKEIYRFLERCTDTDGRMFFLVTEDGRGIQKRRYYYSETFAAIGCAELYKATGDKAVFQDAEAYFNVAYGVFSGQIKTDPKMDPENAPYQALAPAMIMLSTAQVMRSAGINSEKYDRIAQECLAEILEGGYFKEELGALLENVGRDGAFMDTPTGRTVNPGHSIEASWFIMAEGLMSGSQTVMDMGRKILDCSMSLGVDKEHGGIISFCDVSGKPPVALEWDMKLWWPQCEAIIANRLAYYMYKEPKYLAQDNEMAESAFRHFADGKSGEWYGYLHYDNSLANRLKGNIFKGPFHLPRMLMLLAVMEEKGGPEEYLR